MCENQRIQTEDDTAFLLEHAHLTSDDDVESWESFERKTTASSASNGPHRLRPLKASQLNPARSDVTERADGVHVLTSEGTTGPDSQIGQWLPLEVNLCHEALRHCATDVTVDSEASTEVTSVQLTDGRCRSRQGDRRCPREEGEEEVRPSDCRLVCALVLALLATLGCGLVAGLAALYMVIKAKGRRDEGRYTDAKEYLNYAFFIVTVSVFFATPVYIYVFFHIHKSAL